MSQKLVCSCGQTLKVRDELIGKTLHCPKCGTTLRISRKTQPAEVIMEAEVVQHDHSNEAIAIPIQTSLPAAPPSAPSLPSEASPAGTTNPTPPVTTKAKLTAVSTFLGIAIGGIMLLIAGLFMAARSIGSSSWETTQGTITRSVVTSNIESSNRFRSRGVPANQAKSVIIVEYEYAVNGKTFTNDRISFRITEGSNIDTLNALAMKYPKQNKVEVHYNPSNPSASVLDPHIPGLAWIFLVSGMAALVVCGLALPRLWAFFR